MKYLVNFLVLSFTLASLANADIKTTQDSLQFKLNSSDASNMTLNSNGLGVFTTSPSSNLHLNGTLAMSQIVVSSNTTLSNTGVVLVNTISDNIKITLPFAGNVADRVYTIKKTNRNNHVWIVGSNCLIDGTNPIVLSESTGLLPSISVISDGNNWFTIQAQNTQGLIAADNLIAYWTLDETTGTTAYDTSGYGEHGTLQNMGSGNVGFPGKVGNSMRFDGDDDQIAIPSSPNLRLNDSWSISCWYQRISFVNTFPGVWVKGNSSTADGYLLWYNSGGQIHYKRNSNQSFSPTGVISDGAWVHMVFTYDGSSDLISLYQNGQFHSSATVDYGTSSGTDTLYLGRGDQYANGYLDDFRIYNKVLSLQEIHGLYDID